MTHRLSQREKGLRGLLCDSAVLGILCVLLNLLHRIPLGAIDHYNHSHFADVETEAWFS